MGERGREGVDALVVYVREREVYKRGRESVQGIRELDSKGEVGERGGERSTG